MPKEVIQYGKSYFDVKHHETENMGAWSEQYPYKGEREIDRNSGDSTNIIVSSNTTDAPAIGYEYVDKPEGDEVTLTRHPNVEVHWSRPNEFAVPAYDEDAEGKVQLMLDFDRYSLLELSKRVEADPEMTATAAISDNLTRYQINQLIKILRRARNAAYGDDE